MAVPWWNAVADLQTTATTQRWRSRFYMAARSGLFRVTANRKRQKSA